MSTNTSWYMERQLDSISERILPDGYNLRPLLLGREEKLWCDLTNSCFEAEITLQMFLKELKQEDYLEEGLMVLRCGELPVGAVRVSRNADDRGELAFISYLSVVKEHRGKGLGSLLLGKALEFAAERGFSRAGLDVSTENPSATKLYIGEGFKKLDTADE